MKLYEIVHKEHLAPMVIRYRVHAPEIAAKRKAGQFVLIRVCENGERIPLTIADADAAKGTITLIVQSVGKTTNQMAEMQVGDQLNSIAGPLGTPTHIDNYGTVVTIGGGIGIAPLYPITQAMKAAGNHIITILGARNKDLLILEQEMRSLADELIVTTDDGSHGRSGLVTTALKELIGNGVHIDMVVAIGPAIMMKSVAEVTRPFIIPTLASLNSIMVDGTGMCGGCRVTVGGETKFVCVDGPEFDAHHVVWDEMMQRLNMYKAHECRAMERYHREKAAPKEQG